MSASAWQFEVLANVGCDVEAGVDAAVDAVLELVLAAFAPELPAEDEAVLDPPPLDPPQPATSAATASNGTRNFI
ncbi:MAG TPA: hypothetical protein VKT31_07300 [Solirubrobacteraceae bacterium]|nr:hypothetical protein [Solirubrobacteraceae bacterium]